MSTMKPVASTFRATKAMRPGPPSLSGIVLAHNHPSGDAQPSDSDRIATRRLAAAAEALDCTVLDHLVFAGSDCTSLRRLGYL